MVQLIAILAVTIVVIWWWRNVGKSNRSKDWERRRGRLKARRGQVEPVERNPDFDFSDPGTREAGGG